MLHATELLKGPGCWNREPWGSKGSQAASCARWKHGPNFFFVCVDDIGQMEIPPWVLKKNVNILEVILQCFVREAFNVKAFSWQETLQPWWCLPYTLDDVCRFLAISSNIPSPQVTELCMYASGFSKMFRGIFSVGLLCTCLFTFLGADLCNVGYAYRSMLLIDIWTGDGTGCGDGCANFMCSICFSNVPLFKSFPFSSLRTAIGGLKTSNSSVDNFSTRKNGLYDVSRNSEHSILAAEQIGIAKYLL